MKENQTRAMRPPKSARGGKRKLTAVLLSLLLALGIASCNQHFLASNERQAIYRYTIKAYYLDGGSRVITMKGFFPPKVYSYRGAYSLKTCYGAYNGNIRDSETAACRYDLLHTEDITAEYYNAEIVSTQVYDGVTVHTIKGKGGSR